MFVVWDCEFVSMHDADGRLLPLDLTYVGLEHEMGPKGKVSGVVCIGVRAGEFSRKSPGFIGSLTPLLLLNC